MAHTHARSRRNSGSQHQNGWLIFSRPEQHWFFRLLGLIVRFRAELTVLTVTVIVYSYLRDHWGPVTVSMTGVDSVSVDFSHPTIITIVLGATAVGVAAIPATRRYVYRRIWCVITRHRVRACLVQTFTMARANGRLPFLIWARPSPVGEHVTVWLPAGLAVNDLDRVTPQLAAACWAKECRITAFGWKVMLVDVHIVRRNPLGARTVRSDVITDTDTVDTADNQSWVDPGRQQAALASLTPALRQPPGTPAGTGNGSTGNDSTEPDQPSPRPAVLRSVPVPRKPSDPTTTSAATTAPTDSSAVTGYDGVDVSDYV
jgi:hypothetical protein